MHGYGGTNNSEKYMVNQAVKKVQRMKLQRMFYLTEKFSLVAKFQRSLRIQL